MIHDAKVEITCDGKKCKSFIFVDLPAGARNTYLAHDTQIERDVIDQGWIVRDGMHFCCEECAEGDDQHVGVKKNSKPRLTSRGIKLLTSLPIRAGKRGEDMAIIDDVKKAIQVGELDCSTYMNEPQPYAAAIENKLQVFLEEYYEKIVERVFDDYVSIVVMPKSGGKCCYIYYAKGNRYVLGKPPTKPVLEIVEISEENKFAFTRDRN